MYTCMGSYGLDGSSGVFPFTSASKLDESVGRRGKCWLVWLSKGATESDCVQWSGGVANRILVDDQGVEYRGGCDYLVGDGALCSLGLSWGD